MLLQIYFMFYTIRHTTIIFGIISTFFDAINLLRFRYSSRRIYARFAIGVSQVKLIFINAQKTENGRGREAAWDRQLTPRRHSFAYKTRRPAYWA